MDQSVDDCESGFCREEAMSSSSYPGAVTPVQVQQDFETQVVVEETPAEKTFASFQNAVTTIQETPVVSAEELVGEPEKKAYASTVQQDFETPVVVEETPAEKTLGTFQNAVNTVQETLAVSAEELVGEPEKKTHASTVQQDFETEVVAEETPTEKTFASFQNAVNTVQETPAISAEELVGEPEKKTYASTVQQDFETEVVVKETHAEKTYASFQNAVNTVQETPAVSVEELVGEPEKKAYASTLRVGKRTCAPTVTPQPDCTSALTTIQDLPNDVMFDIFARGDMRCVLVCTATCKGWKKVIVNSEFKNAWHTRNVLASQSNSVVVQSSNECCFSVFDAEYFCKDFDVEIPAKKNSTFFCYGACSGLLCISATPRVNFGNPMYILNPSMRRYKQLPNCPALQKKANFVTLGFGLYERGLGLYDPETDYKVVQILRFVRGSFVVQIYSLKVDGWRTITAAPPISEVAQFLEPRSLSLNGVVCWLAVESFSPVIVSFDLEHEEFGKIILPDGLSRTISKFNLPNIEIFEGHLSALVMRKDEDTWHCDIWIMEAANVWRINRTVRLPGSDAIAWQLGIGKDYKVHLVNRARNLVYPKLFVYDIESQDLRDTGIVLSCEYQFVGVHRESLYLLD